MGMSGRRRDHKADENATRARRRCQDRRESQEMQQEQQHQPDAAAARILWDLLLCFDLLLQAGAPVSPAS